jgi:hypothetical protein
MTTAGKNPIYLNLDEVVPDKEVVVMLGGVEHKLAPITLEDFVLNTRIVQNAEASVNPEKESEFVRDMLTRCFPTMTKEMIGKLTFAQLDALFKFAMEHNGASKVQQEATAEAGADPTTAGQ